MKDCCFIEPTSKNLLIEKNKSSKKLLKMATNQEITPVEIEGQTKIFLEVLSELVIKEPEEIDSLIEKESDKTDGAALDAIILVVCKLTQLLQKDIDSLNIPTPLKTALKILKNFLNFVTQSKILNSLKHSKTKKHAGKKRKTVESSGENVSSD